MSTFQVDLDVRVIEEEDYIPFDQVMQLLRQLNEYAPNIDLEEMAESLEKQQKKVHKDL